MSAFPMHCGPNRPQTLTLTAFNAGGTPLAMDSIVLDDMNFNSDLIFTDGFESGDTSAWSKTVP